MSETNEDIDLAFARNMRMRLVEDMIKKELPTDNRDRITLLSALNDISRDAIAIKKIKSDEGIGNKVAEAQAVIAQLLAEPGIKQMGRVDIVEGAVRDVPELPDGVGEVEILAGELETTLSAEDYGTFMARVQAQ